MSARILRRLKAVQDAEEIADFLAKDNLHVAIRFLENAEVTLKLIASSPGSGSPFASAHVHLANLRFRRVKGFPQHLIFYVERSDAVEVVRILHGARDIESELGEP